MSARGDRIVAVPPAHRAMKHLGAETRDDLDGRREEFERHNLEPGMAVTADADPDRTWQQLVPIVDLGEHGLRARTAGTAYHLRWPER
jgi:hypothetical protein